MDRSDFWVKTSSGSILSLPSTFFNRPSINFKHFKSNLEEELLEELGFDHLTSAEIQINLNELYTFKLTEDSFILVIEDCNKNFSRKLTLLTQELLVQFSILQSGIFGWIFESTSKPEKIFSLTQKSVAKQILNWSALRQMSPIFRIFMRRSLQSKERFESSHFFEGENNRVFVFRGYFLEDNFVQGIAIDLTKENQLIEDQKKIILDSCKQLKKYELRLESLKKSENYIVQQIIALKKLFKYIH